ncbi:MAG TPA: hypothetical protein DF614_07725 [Methylococcaceae bacterium]|nr:hypothetical protein [Methylococcaceae bacterium]
MKKLTVVLSSLLLMSTHHVFAKDHSEIALEHAKNAAASTTPAEVVQHAGAALEHTLSAAVSAKGVAKNHLNAGADELEKAIDQGNLKQLSPAVSHSNAAVEHLSAANDSAGANTKNSRKNVLE